MKPSKHEWNYDTPLGKMIMKLKKLGTAIEMKKGSSMSIDDVDYRWVDDRIKYWQTDDRILTKNEMLTANLYWKKFGGPHNVVKNG